MYVFRVSEEREIKNQYKYFTVKLMLLLHLEKAFYIFARFHQLYEEMNRTLLEGLDIL